MSKLEQPSSRLYTPIPSHDDHQNYVVLQPYRTTIRRALIAFFTLLFIAIFIYLFWPSDPTLKIVRLRLIKLHIHALPIITIDVSLHATIQVQNVDVYSMDFTRLDVELRYRGKRLGHVKAGDGHVRAFASSYVEAELELRGVRVLSDVVFLLEDLAKGKVPFDTFTKVEGRFGLSFLEIPLKATMSCEILVNTVNQTIVRQSCSPE